MEKQIPVAVLGCGRMGKQIKDVPAYHSMKQEYSL